MPFAFSIETVADPPIKKEVSFGVLPETLVRAAVRRSIVAGHQPGGNQTSKCLQRAILRAQRGARLNISAIFWRISSPD